VARNFDAVLKDDADVEIVAGGADGWQSL